MTGKNGWSPLPRLSPVFLTAVITNEVKPRKCKDWGRRGAPRLSGVGTSVTPSTHSWLSSQSVLLLAASRQQMS